MRGSKKFFQKDFGIFQNFEINFRKSIENRLCYIYETKKKSKKMKNKNEKKFILKTFFIKSLTQAHFKSLLVVQLSLDDLLSSCLHTISYFYDI